MGAVLVLTGCGMTTDGVAGADGEPGAVTTQDYQPSEVVKPKNGKKLKIGASFPVLDQFLQNVENAIKARGKEAGVEVSTDSAQEKAEVQLSQIENMISSGVDALIVLPQDTATTAPITQRAKEAGIPLVYVNRRPQQLPAGVPYVGSDSLIAGRMEMEGPRQAHRLQGQTSRSSRATPRRRPPSCAPRAVRRSSPSIPR